MIGTSDVLSFSNDPGDYSLTGQVGTTLYVAPELTVTSSKATYSQVCTFEAFSILVIEKSFINEVLEYLCNSSIWTFQIYVFHLKY